MVEHTGAIADAPKEAPTEEATDPTPVTVIVAFSLVFIMCLCFIMYKLKSINNVIEKLKNTANPKW